MSSDAAPRVAGRYERVLVRDPGSARPTWLGRDTVLQRSVVLQQLVVEPEHAAQALREARALTAVDHPNLVAVHDVVTDEDPPLLVLELVDGPTVTALVREHGRRSPREVALLGAQVAAALAAVHRAGLVHGGVGPSSVVIGPGDEAKLAPPATPEHGLVGDRGRSADVWALGQTLDAVLAVRPATAGSLGPVLAAMVADDAEDRITAAEASARLAEVAQEAPAPVVGFGLFPWDDGEDLAATRPVRAAREDLHARAVPAGEGAEQSAAAHGGPPPPGPVETGRGRRRGRGVLLLVGGVGAALLVVGAALALTGRDDSAVPDGVPTSTRTISTSTSTTRTGTPTTATSTASPTSTTTTPQPTTTPPAAPPPPVTTPPPPPTTTTTSTTSSSTTTSSSSSTTPSTTTSTTSSTPPAFTPSPTSEPTPPPTSEPPPPPTSEPTTPPTTAPTAPTQTSGPTSSLTQ